MGGIQTKEKSWSAGGAGQGSFKPHQDLVQVLQASRSNIMLVMTGNKCTVNSLFFPQFVYISSRICAHGDCKARRFSAFIYLLKHNR